MFFAFVISSLNVQLNSFSPLIRNQTDYVLFIVQIDKNILQSHIQVCNNYVYTACDRILLPVKHSWK